MCKLLIAAMLAFGAATNYDGDGNKPKLSVDLAMEGQSDSIWPPFEMCAVGVYVLVHICGDVIKVMKLMVWCCKGCSSISPGMQGRSAHCPLTFQDHEVGGTAGVTACDTERVAGTVSAETMGVGSQQIFSSSTVTNRRLRTEMLIAASLDVVGPRTEPCRCVNEQVHNCALSTGERSMDQLTAVPTIWTTAQGTKYHLFEQCAGQNN